MNNPGTLNHYFRVVDDFFHKTFRDESSVFIAVKARQNAQSVPDENLFAVGNRAAPADVSAKPVSAPPTGAGELATRTWASFSPRMWINRDGTTLGKVKLSCGADLLSICRVEQGLMLNSAGVVAGFGKLRDLVEGLTLSGRVLVNTIAPASQDVTAVRVNYQRNDFYSAVGYQRNGLGSSNLLVDCGTIFLNLLAGAGFERRQLSFLEQQDGVDQIDVMYAGLGFTGVNWSVAAKMTRGVDSWSAARLAFLQRFSASTAVACSYVYDIPAAQADVNIGFTQGFRLRVPAVFQTRRGEPAPASWTVLTPLSFACKASSTGLVAATLRGVSNDSIRWGVVAQRDMRSTNSPVKIGLTLTMEAES